jgi:hypothetical protein
MISERERKRKREWGGVRRKRGRGEGGRREKWQVGEACRKEMPVQVEPG